MPSATVMSQELTAALPAEPKMALQVVPPPAPLHEAGFHAERVERLVSLEPASVSRDEGLMLYRDMTLGRRFEDKCAEMYYRGKMFGFVHQRLKRPPKIFKTIQVIYIFIVVATDSSTACSIRFFGYSLCVISRRILDVSLVFLSYAPTCWRSCCAQRAKSVVRDKVLRRGALAQRVEVRCT